MVYRKVNIENLTNITLFGISYAAEARCCASFSKILLISLTLILQYVIKTNGNYEEKTQQVHYQLQKIIP